MRRRGRLRGATVPTAGVASRVGRRQGDAFGSSAEYLVGVEEEFMVLDVGTLGLVPRASEIVVAADDPENVKQEIRRSMVETSSRPAITIEDLRSDLLALRRSISTHAAERGCLIAAAGAHPFSSAEEQEVTETARYRYVADLSGWVGRRATAVFGTHVHVSVASAEKALGVMEALLPDLPTLVAVSATSPLWEGRDTGFASSRLAVRAELPRTGLPPRFDSLADYQATLDSLRRSGLVPDPSYLWWDVRLQARLGTLEIRILDAQPSVHDTVALAGVVQALVRHHGVAWDAGVRPRTHRMLVEENRWQAVRHGMTAAFVGPRGKAVPALQAVDELLVRVSDDAAAIGAMSALGHVHDLAARGGVVTDLRDTMRRTDDAGAVTRHLVELGQRDLPDPATSPRELVAG
jgi:carboxylate-amine ligase